MSGLNKFLPGTGRWQSAGLTEGAPSTKFHLVPLPVPGRIYNG